MKIEMTVDGSQLGDTIIKTFENLSPEQHQQIAKEVCAQWFLGLNTAKSHREAFEANTIENIRSSESYYRDKTDADIRSNYRFQDEMKKYKNPQTEIVSNSTREVNALVIKAIQEEVVKNEEIKKIVEAVGAEIKANFKNYVHDALMAFMCGHMGSIANGIQQALVQSSNADNLAQNVARRLNGG
jgi:hypothetical protein